MYSNIIPASYEIRALQAQGCNGDRAIRYFLEVAAKRIRQSARNSDGGPQSIVIHVPPYVYHLPAYRQQNVLRRVVECLRHSGFDTDVNMDTACFTVRVPAAD